MNYRNQNTGLQAAPEKPIRNLNQIELQLSNMSNRLDHLEEVIAKVAERVVSVSMPNPKVNPPAGEKQPEDMLCSVATDVRHRVRRLDQLTMKLEDVLSDIVL